MLYSFVQTKEHNKFSSVGNSNPKSSSVKLNIYIYINTGGNCSHKPQLRLNLSSDYFVLFSLQEKIIGKVPQAMPMPDYFYLIF